MKIKNIEVHHFDEEKDFYDISTATGNFVVSNKYDGIVVHNSHIASLIVTALLKLVPDLYHHHKIYRVIMPLYGVKNWKGKFLPFWNQDEMLEFKSKNPKVQITRYKGLGEMNPPELAACVLDPETRKLEEICDCNEYESQEIFKMMSDVQTKRDMLNDEE